MGSTSNKQLSGFTIVELLIVVVVIAILAAITIVAYNGISSRAKTSSAASAAASVAKAVEIYSSQIGAYPSTQAALNGSSSNGQPYATPNVVFLSAIPTSAPSNPASVTLTKCDASGGSTGGLGNQIVYWNYSTNSIGAYTQGSTGSGCQIAL
ncbi:MAG: prepilin-type N-terminal cleavage/methylation domain-containing protein [Candidatus Microsaccharimonas sp.]